MNNILNWFILYIVNLLINLYFYILFSPTFYTSNILIPRSICMIHKQSFISSFWYLKKNVWMTSKTQWLVVKIEPNRHRWLPPRERKEPVCELINSLTLFHLTYLLRLILISYVLWKCRKNNWNNNSEKGDWKFLEIKSIWWMHDY